MKTSIFRQVQGRNVRNVLLSTFALFFCISLLCACAAPSASKWQEQYDLGMRYLTEGNYTEAVIAFTAAIEIDPKRAESYIGAAKACAAQGDEAKAVEWLQKGMEQASDTTELAAMLEELGVAVPTDAPVQQDAGSKEQAQSDKPMGDGDEELVRLLWEGIDWDIGTESNYTILGVPVAAMTVDSLRAAAEAQGAEIDAVHDAANGIDGFSAKLPEGSCVQGTTGMGRKVECVLSLNRSDGSGYGYPTGTYGICLGDSFETVLGKLGFHNAAQIASRCSQLVAEHSGNSAYVYNGEAGITVFYDFTEGNQSNTTGSIRIDLYNGDAFYYAFENDALQHDMFISW